MGGKLRIVTDRFFPSWLEPRSKLSDFEGGVRVTAFVSGGWVESHGQSGTKRNGLIAIAE